MGYDRIRKGYTPRNMIYLLGIAILAALFVGGGLQISTRLQSGAETEVARVDAQRFSNAFTLLASEGNGYMRLDSTNDYGSIAVEGEELVLNGGFLDEPLRRQLPRAFTYQEGEVSGDALCVYRQGARYSIGIPPCEAGRVACDETTTMTGTTPGSGDIRTMGRCVYYERENAPTYGWYCEGGQYTSKDFYEQYYGSCSPQPDVFIEVNRIVCPDEVEPGATYGCYASFTYSCRNDIGQVTATLSTPAGDTTVRRGCTAEVGHSRVSQTFSASGSPTVAVTVSTPGGVSDTRQTTFDVRQPRPDR